MVKLDKIYTRGGDGGQTSLGDGRRVDKTDTRVAAFGTVDEANAIIGLARLHVAGRHDAMLGRIQNDLFDLGADLCIPEDSEHKSATALRVSAHQVTRLESEIDEINGALEPLTSFILPGGTPGAAYLHMARTVTRRAERDVITLNATEAINPHTITYLNRLSDHLFVLARFLNNKGTDDVLWTPGDNR